MSGNNAKKKTNPVEWSDAAEEAFQTLINKCTNAPILAYADFCLPFELHIDASGIGLGAVLYQTVRFLAVFNGRSTWRALGTAKTVTRVP